MKLLVTLFFIASFCFDIRREGAREDTSKQKRKSDKQWSSRAIFTVYSHVTVALNHLYFPLSSPFFLCCCTKPMFASRALSHLSCCYILIKILNIFLPRQECLSPLLSIPLAIPPICLCCPMTSPGSINNDNCIHGHERAQSTKHMYCISLRGSHSPSMWLTCSQSFVV